MEKVAPYYILIKYKTPVMDFTKLTAQFMSNRKFAEKMDGPDRLSAHQAFLNDIEFYKERSAELTLALLNERDHIEPHLTKDVLTAFNTYMRACICFFRTKDLNDIQQTEYEHLSRRSNKTEQELEEEALQELDEICGGGEDIPYQCADNIMMRQIKLRNPHTLDRFLKYEKVDVPVSIILPMQKEIDLGHPDLKTKPFFPPPVPPSIPQQQSVIDDVRAVAQDMIEEILSSVVEKIEKEVVTPVPIPISPPPEKQDKKKRGKKKKEHNHGSTKPVTDSLHLDI